MCTDFAECSGPATTPAEIPGQRRKERRRTIQRARRKFGYANPEPKPNKPSQQDAATQTESSMGTAVSPSCTPLCVTVRVCDSPSSSCCFEGVSVPTRNLSASALRTMADEDACVDIGPARQEITRPSADC
eukprot:TRINITY_DN64291_c0_g1_i1.p2 TRINITY_DN64291_c0_g1~~TRINITY_DN64291_c0_g1_i1.p2  ORF type:complete len:131 (-),score=14.89 TRINITY_DN64291_c0_g1_i1:211-603(-)